MWDDFEYNIWIFRCHILYLKSEEGRERGTLTAKWCLLGHGGYPCVTCGARGRLHSGNVCRTSRARRVEITVRVCRGSNLRRAHQVEVGVGGRNERVTATATIVSVSKM